MHSRKAWALKGCVQAVALALAAMASPAGAVDFTWIGGTGDWSPNSGSNWNQLAGLPGGADNVFIDNGAVTNSVVSLNVGTTINNLNISIGDSLGVNSGANFIILGNVGNNGNLGLNSLGSATALRIGPATTFSGGGTLTMSNNGSNRILGNSGATTEVLTNTATHTIQGAGQLGLNQMGLNNQGLILANQSAGLTIDLSDGAGITRANTGTLRAAGGQLTIAGTSLTNTGGVIDAVGSNVLISGGSTITGGTLQSSSGGKVLLQGSSNLANVSNTGQTEIANAQTGLLTGTFTNSGNLQLASSGSQTDLRLNGNVTLTGAGTVTMSNNVNNRILGHSGATTEVLTNALGHTIQGAGQLGANQMGLNNQGLIEANGSAGLVIDVSASGMTNSGTLRAGTGVLTIQNSTVSSTPSGVLDAAGNNIVITGSTINGTVQGSGGNKILVQNSSNLVDVTNSTQLEISNAQTGLLTGTFTNTGNLQLASSGSQTDLRLSGNVTLTGAGTVTMSNNGNNRILGHSGATTEVLTNALGHTIQGAGQLGANQMGLNNLGLIEANGLAGLVIDVSATGMTNGGTLRAGTGVLTIQNSVVSSTPSGVLDAAGNNIVITGSTINGTVQGSGGNKILVQNSSNLVDVTNSTQLEIANAQTGLLSGTFTNSGNLQLASTGSQTDLRLNGDVTLTGSGTVTMSNNGNNRIYGNSGSTTEVLTNAAGHTIQGAGQLGVNQTGLNNQGLILANQSTELTIDLSNGAGITRTNTGTLRAAGGQLTITGTGLANTGGVIDAVGSNVLITGGSTITGGTLQSSSGGKLLLQGFSNLTNVSNTGQLEIANAQTGLLTGTFTNSGNLQLASSGSQTNLQLNGNVTLTGGGTLTVSDNGQNRILGNSGATTEVLTNTATHTIQGAGQFGANQMGLNNQGLILANQSTGLTIDLSDGAGITRANTGTLRAAGGQLTITFTSLANTGGVIDALGSNVLISGSSTITGGTLQSSGGGKVLLQSSSNLANVSNTGQTEIANAQTGLLTGTFTNSGNLQLASSGSQTNLQLNGNVTLTGAGTLTMSNNGQNRILGNSGGTTEVLTNAAGHTVQGAGQLGINQMGLNNQGLILANESTALTINTSAAGMTNSGTLQANAGSTLDITDGFTNSGTVRANGGTVNANGGFSAASGTVLIEGNGIVSIGANSSTSTLTHNSSNAAGLSLGVNNLTVLGDYTNANSGTGNAFNRRANVTGTGEILAGGNATQAITGTGVTNGNTANATLTIGNVRVGATTFDYQVANTGSTGPSLRGAIQTNVNGATLNDARLSGAGVTAGNYNTGAPGNNTGNLGVTFTAANAGALAPLSGQVLNLRSNFDNIADQKLNIVLGSGAAAYNAAVGNATPTPVVLGNQRVGGTLSQQLTIANTAAAGAFSEDLNAGFGANTGAASNNSGSVNGVLAGANNAAAMSVGVNTASAGAKIGTVTLNYQTAGAVNGVSNGLGTASADSQTINVSGNVYQLAAGQLNTAPLNFGTVQVGQLVQQTLSISNLAAAGAFSEDLNASFGTTSGTNGNLIGGIGAINGLLAGSTNASNMVVSVNTGAAATINGAIAVNFVSAGAVNGVSNGLGTFGVGSTNYGVSGVIQTGGQVIDQAVPVISNSPINLGNVRIGSISPTALVSVTNQATGNAQAALNASISGNAPITASGSFNLLAPGGTDASHLQVGMNTGNAGVINGTATLTLVSDASNVGNCAPNCLMPLASKDVLVNGAVYRLANPTLNTPSVTIAARVGDPVSANQAVSFTNTSPDIYTEGLKVAVTGTSGNAQSNGGGIANLAAQGTNNSAIQVGLASTAIAGTSNGPVTLGLTSTGAGTTGAADISVGSKVIDVVGKVYQKAVALVQKAVVFGIVHVGDVVTARNVQVQNTAPAMALNDTLTGSIGGAVGPFNASGNLAGVTAGGTDSSSLNVGLNTSTAGIFSGNATVNLASHNPDMADLMLANAAVLLGAQVNNYANADLNKTSGNGGLSQSGRVFTLDFGNVTLGASVSSWLAVINDVAGPADLLDGLFSFLDFEDFNYAGFGSFAGLDAGQSQGGLNVGFNALAIGGFSDDIRLATLGHNISGYSGARGDITLHIRANVVQDGGTVPEPGTLALLGIALAGLMLSRRRATLH